MKDRIEAVLERSRVSGIGGTRPQIKTMERAIDYSRLKSLPRPRTMRDVLEISILRGKMGLF